MKYTEKFWDGWITVDSNDFPPTEGAFKTFMLAVIIGVFLIGVFILLVCLFNFVSSFFI